ncbi:unnamed protein product [Heterobilharzia americana]|nr:unnamed protein product [Heterobilharzia americana]
MALEQEIRHLFDSNTKNWSKCEVLSHENYLLRQENDLLKKEIASLWCIRENVNDPFIDRIPRTIDYESQVQPLKEDTEGETCKQNMESNETSVEDLLYQLSERNCQIDLLQRRLSFMLHERGVLYHQLEEMSIAQDKFENKTHLTAKNKRSRLLMNTGTLKDDCSKYSYRSEIDSNCDTEFTSEVVPTTSIITTSMPSKPETTQSASSPPSFDECKPINRKMSELKINEIDG